MNLATNVKVSLQDALIFRAESTGEIRGLQHLSRLLTEREEELRNQIKHLEG